MISKCIIFWLFIISFSDYNVNADNTLCGNWQTYKDEKCIKIIDQEKLVSFEDALKSCSQIDNKSQILTIHSKEEQDFISEYLFKTHKLVENVWIGLRNTSKTFEWTDTLNKNYNNWKTGNPTDKLDYNCVQIEPESFLWINEPCIKKGLIVCQKLPEVTLSDLLKQFLETKEDLKQTKEDLKETKEGLKKSVEDFKQTKEDLKQTKEQLKETQNEKNEIFNVVFNNKVSHYQLFTDINGKNKAFIIPLSAMRGRNTFDESVNLCKTFNSTLIEIQSLDKQNILESFLGRLGFESYQFFSIWINGLRDTSGKWKWIESNTQFNYTNWASSYPLTDSSYSDSNNIYVSTHSTDTFGKWYNYPKAYTSYVICEHTFGF